MSTFTNNRPDRMCRSHKPYRPTTLARDPDPWRTLFLRFLPWAGAALVVFYFAKGA